MNVSNNSGIKHAVLYYLSKIIFDSFRENASPRKQKWMIQLDVN